MAQTGSSGSGNITARIEDVLRRCVTWSRSGQHRKIVSEVDRHLSDLEDHPKLRSVLLIWKSQALLAQGRAEEALPSASQSWDLDPSPHACHLTAVALEALGDLDGAEELLRMGWRLFPEAVHLPVQLAVILSDQGRHPEALDVLKEVPIDHSVPVDLQVFLFGMRSNLLAAMGRWAEAEEILRQGIDRHPASDLLSDAHSALRGARKRTRAEKALAASWTAGLDVLDGGAVEVDEAVIRCGDVNELPEIVVLAARRLWRAYVKQRSTRPHVPDVWGAAFVFSILELDGDQPSATALARSLACSPSSVRTVIRRVRSFLGSLDPEIARRAFAARANPRLEGPARSANTSLRPADILEFPTS